VIYKSTDYGQTFSHLYSVAPKFVTEYAKPHSTNRAVFIISFFPGYGILKSPDLNTYESILGSIII